MSIDEVNSGAAKKTRRDFMQLLATAFGGIGGVLALWPFVNSLNPPQNNSSSSSVDVDISNIPEGEAITVMWKSRPVFIRHRTKEEIAEAQSVDVQRLTDKQSDSDRVQRPEWLVTVGICTHLGCVPSGQKSIEKRGDYGGWFCPCHGAHYDTSGRVRKGPAPKNLAIPPYEFLDDTTIKIG